MSNTLVITADARVIEIGIRGHPRSVKRLSLLTKELDQRHDYEALYKFAKEYFSDALITITDTQLIFVEDVLCSLVAKARYCDIFLRRIGCQSITFVPNAILSCISSSVSNALVVDMRYEFVTCVPIFDFRIIDSCIMLSKRSVRWANDTFGGISLTDQKIDGLLGDKEGVSYDGDEMPMGALINKALQSLARDLRRPVGSNIILCGSSRDQELISSRLADTIPQKSRLIEGIDPWHAASSFPNYLIDEFITEKLRITKSAYDDPLHKIPDWHEIKYERLFK